MLNIQRVALLCFCWVFPALGRKAATAWIWQCSEDETEWNSLAQFMENSTAIDTISLGAYSVINGSFEDGWNCGELMRKRIPFFQSAAPSVRHTPLIDAGQRGIEDLRMMWNSTESSKKFISTAVANMMKMKLDGYNLDWEVQGTPQDRDNFVRFVRDFASAIHSANPKATLSSDVAGSLLYGNCTSGGDYLGVTCGNYTSAKVDNVVSMGTYTHETDAFCGTIQRASASATVFPEYAPGIDLGTPDSNITAYFECLTQAPSIQRVFLWAFGFNKPASLSPVWSSALNKWAIHE